MKRKVILQREIYSHLYLKKKEIYKRLKLRNMERKTIGIVLIVLGIIMMIYTGFNYITTENVVDLGPLQINKQENHPVQWSPIVGALLLVGGIIIIATNKNNK